MANVEQFLNETRTLALRVMETTADLAHVSDDQLRARRASLGAGWDQLAEGAERVVTETPLVPSPGGRARAPCAALTPCWSSGSAAKD